jgi:hypothetical protein
MARQRRSGEKRWMLRTSPHNEDFVLAVARTKEDLQYIAEQYVLEIYDDLDYIESYVDFTNNTVVVSFGTHEDLEGNRQTFYISEVEVL